MNIMDEEIINSEFDKVTTKYPLIKKIFKISTNHINFKMGSIAGLLCGSVVFYINEEYGIWASSAAFVKQFSYNLFIGGYNIKLCEKLAISDKKLSIAYATIIPPVSAFLMTYAIHKIGSTPEAFNSSIWQVPLNTVGSYLFAHYFKHSEKKRI